MRMHRAWTLGMIVLAAASVPGCCRILCPPKAPHPQREVRPGGGPARVPGLVEVHRTEFGPNIALSPLTQIGYRYTSFDPMDNATEWWLLQAGIDVPVDVGVPGSMSQGQVVVLRALPNDPQVFDGASLCAKYGGTYTALSTVSIPAQIPTNPCGGP